MKAILVILALTSFSTYATDRLLQDKHVKEIVYDAIVEDTYFEDDGFQRILDPKAFTHKIVKESDSGMVLRSVGTGYSAWDDKEITISCDVEIESFECAPEVTKINCSLENENWPNG